MCNVFFVTCCVARSTTETLLESNHEYDNTLVHLFNQQQQQHATATLIWKSDTEVVRARSQDGIRAQGEICIHTFQLT